VGLNHLAVVCSSLRQDLDIADIYVALMTTVPFFALVAIP